MNFLIIGGLLAFALVAILAAVLLGMGEQRSEKVRAAEQQATSTQSVVGAPIAPGGPIAPVAPIAPTMQTTLEQPESPTLRRTIPLSQGLRLSSESAELTQPMQPSLPSPTPQPLQPARVIERDYASSALNGQMHLFAEELHSLRQQAWELEQRLQGLADMLDRVQHAQSQHLDAEEAVEDSR